MNARLRRLVALTVPLTGFLMARGVASRPGRWTAPTCRDATAGCNRQAAHVDIQLSLTTGRTLALIACRLATCPHRRCTARLQDSIYRK
ncbi:hypothetical protein C8039_05460 [Halogeometricum sp. wsp3]|nr:hypothetical protein C8039_05460 [Halogeometricum sp. wsp3]